MKWSFNHIAKATADARKKTLTKLSQSEMAFQLGYKNGQLVSNIERGKCSVPAHRVHDFARLLEVPIYILTEAMILDYSESIRRIAYTTPQETTHDSIASA